MLLPLELMQASSVCVLDLVRAAAGTATLRPDAFEGERAICIPTRGELLHSGLLAALSAQDGTWVYADPGVSQYPKHAAPSHSEPPASASGAGASAGKQYTTKHQKGARSQTKMDRKAKHTRKHKGGMSNPSKPSALAPKQRVFKKSRQASGSKRGLKVTFSTR